MKILVVEDDINRINWFRSQFSSDAEVHYIDIASKGADFVKKNKYDMIFLDHDLGDNHPGSGYTVAKALSNTSNKSAMVCIHSWNPVGAMNMKECLVNAGFTDVNVARFGSFSIK